MTSTLFNGTPHIAISDNRGNVVRSIQYNRVDVTDPVDELISCTVTRDDGLQNDLFDARLFGLWQEDSSQLPNSTGQLSLGGQPLRIDSVDAGWSVVLHDAEGRPVWAKDSRGTIARWAFDTLGRLTTVFEQAAGAQESITQQIIFGDNDSTTAKPEDNNLRGKIVRHYDDGGKSSTRSFTLAGAPLSATQQLLSNVENQSNWQGEESDWQAALDSSVYTSTTQYNALGVAVLTVDAKGHQQRMAFDVAGMLSQQFLTLSGSTEQTLQQNLTYSAAGQTLQETAGNGVVTNYDYEPETQRLLSVKTTRPASGSRSTVLQDLHYQYDPVGNILAIGNQAEQTRYYAGQEITPENCYSYDALYQLITASGRENSTTSPQSPSLPDAVTDSTQVVNYSRNYRYDNGGNLSQISHSGASTYTHLLAVAAGSNRAVAQDDSGSITPQDVEAYFDPRGNVSQMQPGTPLNWNVRNQLQTAITVQRSTTADSDREIYQYSGAERIRKQTRALASSVWQVSDVIYLPGLELRTSGMDSGSGITPNEQLQIVTTRAGRAQIRVLHWDSGLPEGINNDQIRYSFDNQIGSVMLEVDSEASVLTVEEYYPFGGTAVLAAKNSIEVKYKTRRYSGKERDSTGLYYYGYRYYAPWLGRWINPDPAGMVDGPNVYCMVNNNPITDEDIDGRAKGKRVVNFISNMAPFNLFEKKNALALSQESAGLRPALQQSHKNYEKQVNPFPVVNNWGYYGKLRQHERYDYLDIYRSTNGPTLGAIPADIRYTAIYNIKDNEPEFARMHRTRQFNSVKNRALESGEFEETQLILSTDRVKDLMQKGYLTKDKNGNYTSTYKKDGEDYAFSINERGFVYDSDHRKVKILKSKNQYWNGLLPVVDKDNIPYNVIKADTPRTLHNKRVNELVRRVNETEKNIAAAFKVNERRTALTPIRRT